MKGKSNEQQREREAHHDFSFVHLTLKSLSGLLVLWYLLLGVTPCVAQTTTVTGTVNDANGLPYSNGAMKAGLVFAGTPVSNPTVTISVLAQCKANGFGSAPCQVPFNPNAGPYTLDPSGNVPGGGITLQDNSLVTPAGTQWQFTVSEVGVPPPFGTGPQTCSTSVAVTGVAQSITAAFPTCPALTHTIIASNSAGAAVNFFDTTNGPTIGTFGTTNLSPTVTDGATDYSFTQADVGKFILITNQTIPTFSLTSNYIIPNPSTILSVQSAHSITISSNATATCTIGCAGFIWKTDDAPALNAVWASVTKVGVCGSLLMQGYIPVGAPIQSTGGCGKNAQQQAGTNTAAALGVGINSAVIVPLPGFNAASCTAANGGCFFGIAGTNTFSGVQMDSFTIHGLGQDTVTNGSGAIALFCGTECFAHNLALYEWGGNSGVIGLQTAGAVGGPANLLNITNFDFGNSGFSLGGTVVANNIQAIGVPSSIGSAATVSSNNSYFACTSVAAQCMSVGGAATWKSVADQIQTLGPGANIGVLVQGSGATLNLIGANFLCAATSTAIQVLSGGSAHVSQSGIPCAGATAVNNAGSFFDDGGNFPFTGTITNTGGWFGSGSVSGTALVTGNVGLTSGWGTSTVASVAAGSDSHRGRFTITGAAGAANPTLTLTFPFPYFVPPASCSLFENTTDLATLTSVASGAPSTTSVLFTFAGTPAAVTYIFDYQCGP
jgi:hypothetical protein